MTEDDLDRVVAIEAASFPQPWTRAHFADELQSPFSFPLVARDSSGVVVGYICPSLIVDEAEIRDVAVDPSFRGRGVGKHLVEEILRRARSREAAFVALEVRQSNTAAIGLYREVGFTETGRRRSYYRDGEDAILMEYRFP